MSSQAGGDWRRKVREVTWPDVWVWAADIQREYGLFAKVELWPPTGSGRDPYGRVCVSLSCVLPNVGMQVRHIKWQDIPRPSTTNVAAVALSILAAFSKQLDLHCWEAEQGAERGERLL